VDSLFIILAVVYFYDTIKSYFESFLGQLKVALGISTDILIALLGYYLYTRKSGWMKDVGLGLMAGAVAKIAVTGISLGVTTTTTAAAPSAAPTAAVKPSLSAALAYARTKALSLGGLR
jgi:surface polysaccharide O-acyltransferase-like enzyme